MRNKIFIMVVIVNLLLTFMLLPQDIKGAPLTNSTGSKVKLYPQMGHAGFIDSISISHDKKFIITGGWDGTARLWDRETGLEIHKFDDFGGEHVIAVFSPIKNVAAMGSYNVGSKGGSIRLYDIKMQKEIWRIKWLEMRSLKFSKDGESILVTGKDNENYSEQVMLLESKTGKKIKVMNIEHIKDTSFLIGAISPDNGIIATGYRHVSLNGGRISLWNTVTESEIGSFTGLPAGINSLEFSSDGKMLLGAGEDGRAYLWDISTRELIRTFTHKSRAIHSRGLKSACFSPKDDNIIVTSGPVDSGIKIWDVKSGKEIKGLNSGETFTQTMVFSIDGDLLLSGGSGRFVHIWDVDAWKKVDTIEGKINGSVSSISFSADGKLFLAEYRGKSYVHLAFLFDSGSGNLIRTFPPGSGYRHALAPDGRIVVKESISFIDAVSREKLGEMKGSHPVFSPDGSVVLTIWRRNSLILWDASNFKKISEINIPVNTRHVSICAISPDGKLAATSGVGDDEHGNYDMSVRVWDTTSGMLYKRLMYENGWVHSLEFSSDGKRILIGGHSASLWDIETEKQIRKFTDDKFHMVRSAVFAEEYKYILTSGADGFVRKYEKDSGKLLNKLSGHTGAVSFVTASPDGQVILSGGEDGSIIGWDGEKGNRLFQLITFKDGTWAVIDPDGRYDASNGGDVNGLIWVVGNEPIVLSQLKERYYEPGLFAKIMGINKEPLMDVEKFADVKLFPDVKLSKLTPLDPELAIQLKNRGGGIGRVVVKINGKELTADARNCQQKATPNAKEHIVKLNLADDPRLELGASNEIEVQAFNSEDYLRSIGVQAIYTPPGEKDPAKPQLWAIIAGVSDYRGEKIDLRYAAKDAEDFAKAIKIAAMRLFDPIEPRIMLFTTSKKKEALIPNRKNLLNALRATLQSKPQDILVVYLSGHGFNYGEPKGDYYFLTSEAQGSDLKDPVVREHTAISGKELTEFIKQAPAGKTVLILDTCVAGQLIDKLFEKRYTSSNRVRALERIKDRTGFHILAGSAANRVSYETSRYAQGLLTYSLLFGMRGEALRKGEFVAVIKLFQYARDKVPELARGIGGIQSPVIASPKGGDDFVIGQITSEDKHRIPLETPKPLVLQTRFELLKKPRDPLKLTRKINEVFLNESTPGYNARTVDLVFVDADEFPGAYEVGGRYSILGNNITVNLFIYQGEKELGQFEITGKTTMTSELAVQIVEEVKKWLRSTMTN